MTSDHATKMDHQLLVAEVEVSITERCTLACSECGFLVPRQPPPSLEGDPVRELQTALIRLRALGVRAGSLAVMGGEPTIDGPLLVNAVRAIRSTGFADRIEVVTNGLTPGGLRGEALSDIDQLTISVYAVSEGLLERWRRWLALSAPHVRLVLRRNAGDWDAWTATRRVSDEEAQRLFQRCWYRRHCVTIERQRLFLCSRIAKMSHDSQGIRIDATTTLGDVRSYLGRGDALPACATCTPMMDLPPVPAGMQPDDRVARLEIRALAWLDAAIARAEAGDR